MGDCNFINNNSSTGSVIYAKNSSMVLVANNTVMNDATMYFITSNFL